jgi:hypothetical protein
VSRALVIALAAVLAVPAFATTRSYSAKSAFAKLHACPATGKHTVSCKGYVIDHVKPLDCGGADAPSNMRWQTIAAAKAKDKWERSDPSCKHPTTTPKPKVTA